MTESERLIDLHFRPLQELEAAQELAETLLHDHKDLLGDDLAGHLSSLMSDLSAVIEDSYGISDAKPGAAIEAGA